MYTVCIDLYIQYIELEMDFKILVHTCTCTLYNYCQDFIQDFLLCGGGGQSMKDF